MTLPWKTWLTIIALILVTSLYSAAYFVRMFIEESAVQNLTHVKAQAFRVVDSSGTTRLNVYLSANGHPTIAFSDENGLVVTAMILKDGKLVTAEFDEPVVADNEGLYNLYRKTFPLQRP